MERRPALSATLPTHPFAETPVLKQADSTLQVAIITDDAQRVIRRATGPFNDIGGILGMGSSQKIAPHDGAGTRAETEPLAASGCVVEGRSRASRLRIGVEADSPLSAVAI